MNKYMYVSVCVSVSVYVCLSISPHSSFSLLLSLPFSLPEFVCVNFLSQLWRKNILHFSPCSDPRAELSYVLEVFILLYVFFFFHILSFSTMCFCSSQGTWLNLGQDQLIFAQYLTMWVSCTGFLDWKLRYSSMTFKMVPSTWKAHVCILPLHTQIVKKTVWRTLAEMERQRT